MNNNKLVINYKGQSKPLAEWADELDIEYDVLYGRLYGLRWTIEKAFNTPLQKRVVLSREAATEIRSLIAEGKISQSAIARKYNVSRSNISYIKSNKSWKMKKHKPNEFLPT